MQSFIAGAYLLASSIGIQTTIPMTGPCYSEVELTKRIEITIYPKDVFDQVKHFFGRDGDAAIATLGDDVCKVYITFETWQYALCHEIIRHCLNNERHEDE